MQSRSLAAIWLMLSGLSGCDEPAAPSGASPEPARAAPPAASAAPTAPPVSPGGSSAGGERQTQGTRTHRAARCGECHEKMYREWRESPHAHTSDSELYLAMRKTSDASCDRCHEPLRTLGAGAALARSEGVSCEVCHRIDRVSVRADQAEAPLLASGSTKYGPRCDARSPYFHKTECSPIFEASEFCAACHLWSVPDANGAFLPVHSEYADWLRGPYAARGKTCQSCHMLPGVRAELATGEPERDGVPDHGFWGRGGELAGSALVAHAEASWKGEALTVKVNVENARAGHYIPAGAPGQQIVLRVTALDKNGGDIASDERVFERRVVSSDGKARAIGVASGLPSDTRIAALATRREAFTLNAPAAGTARVELLRRSDPELSRRLGGSSVPERPISSITLSLRSNDGARRIASPRSALVR